MSVNKFRNFKMVGYVVYGRGSFNQLDEILAPQRKGDAPMVFLLDHYFENKPLAKRIPLALGSEDLIELVKTSTAIYHISYHLKVAKLHILSD